jgi:predicted Rossmann fold flavoprotein
MPLIDFAAVGGGPAAIFAAIHAKAACPESRVLVLEKSAVLLSKVRISGGGRCNVTHGCFDPAELVKNYPRGGQELLGPFHRFQPKDTIAWFEERGVALKQEADGRIFPISNNSETIIRCLLLEAEKLGAQICTRAWVEAIDRTDAGFQIRFKQKEPILARRLLLATGGSAEGFGLAASLGHTIHPPVPSLFTFNVPTSPLKELSGLSIQDAQLRLGSFIQRGPLLLTHFGFSGPAALKLSAFAARHLHETGYKAPLTINYLPALSQEEIFKTLWQFKQNHPHKALHTEPLFPLPKKLWRALLAPFPHGRAQELPQAALRRLAETLQASVYLIDGKTTNKEEFVTCGGVALKEINFKTMESRLCPNLFFAGEILDIDGITGGFNFQNCWTTGAIAGRQNKQIS